MLTGVVCVQVGAGLAARLFSQVPPAAVTGLRLWTAAVLLAVLGARGLHREISGLIRRRGKDAPVPHVDPGVICLRVGCRAEQAPTTIDTMRRHGALRIERSGEA